MILDVLVLAGGILSFGLLFYAFIKSDNHKEIEQKSISPATR